MPNKPVWSEGVLVSQHHFQQQDRYHEQLLADRVRGIVSQAIEVIDRVPGLDIPAAHIKQQFRDALIEHTRYVREHGEDMPQIRDWVWPYGRDAGGRG